MRPIQPTGPRNSPLIAIVGEAPGQEEQRRGSPFLGPSGHLLDQILASAGIARADCFITNVSDVRPPRNDFGVFYSDKKREAPTTDLINHRARLWKELKEVQPKIIVACGEEALKATAMETKVGNHRGKIIEVDRGYNHYRIMPVWHPAYVLRQYGEKPILELDIKKALRQARVPHTPQMNFNLKPTLDEVLAFCDMRYPRMAFDIESIGPCARTMGFAWSPNDAISIQLIDKNQHRWKPDEEAIILQSLNSLLRDPEIEFYIQNFPFDCSMIGRELGFHVQNLVLDTMYAWNLLYPELPKSLDFLSSVHTDFHMYWGPNKFGTDDSNARYNCYDCCATWISAQAIITELKERDLWEYYNKRTHPTVAALTRMQNRGILIDESKKEIVRSQTEDKLKSCSALLETLLGFEINPDSPKQVAELVYDTWNLPKQRKPGTKTITADVNALKALARKFPNRSEVINTILECRQTRKLISTYIDQKLKDGRALTSFGITVSGRITSGATWDGYGGNLQNIPRGSFRTLYIPDPGYTLIKADLKQAEYMVFCWDAQVHPYIEEYSSNPNFDVHSLNASMIFDKPVNEIDKGERYQAKQGVYAGNYKIGPKKMSLMYGIPFQEAKLVLTRYQAVRPELAIWWTTVTDQLKTTRSITNVFGRERLFFGRMDEELFRKGLNWICQSTVADIINQALVTLDNSESDLIIPLLQVHDELVCQCPIGHEDKAVAEIRLAMEIPITFPEIPTPMIIPAEISTGPNWFDQTDHPSNA